jgi:hypothetical protein
MKTIGKIVEAEVSAGADKAYEVGSRELNRSQLFSSVDAIQQAQGNGESSIEEKSFWSAIYDAICSLISLLCCGLLGSKEESIIGNKQLGIDQEEKPFSKESSGSQLAEGEPSAASSVRGDSEIKVTVSEEKNGSDFSDFSVEDRGDAFKEKPLKDGSNLPLESVKLISEQSLKDVSKDTASRVSRKDKGRPASVDKTDKKDRESSDSLERCKKSFSRFFYRKRDGKVGMLKWLNAAFIKMVQIGRANLYY